uniref:Uncharacterized protein n=1 Tax=Anthurium amnicola TaxID=1678845 RepID=A0A1D1YHU3_9ARAE
MGMTVPSRYPVRLLLLMVCSSALRLRIRIRNPNNSSDFYLDLNPFTAFTSDPGRSCQIRPGSDPFTVLVVMRMGRSQDLVVAAVKPLAADTRGRLGNLRRICCGRARTATAEALLPSGLPQTHGEGNLALIPNDAGHTTWRGRRWWRGRRDGDFPSRDPPKEAELSLTGSSKRGENPNRRSEQKLLHHSSLSSSPGLQNINRISKKP